MQAWISSDTEGTTWTQAALPYTPTIPLDGIGPPQIYSPGLPMVAYYISGTNTAGIKYPTFDQIECIVVP
jgi:hypothetical protein